MYLFADLFYLLLITIIPYRRKVVRKNLVNSFPEKSAKELRQIERKFYRHLTQILVESTKNLTISEKQLKKRIKVINPEVVNNLYDEGKSVLLVSGHYNNWEWLITAQNLLFKHQAVGIGMPLTNQFWNQALNARRARFGMKIIYNKIVHEFYNNNRDLTASLVLADQSPSNSRKSYWMKFLNQQTAVLFGPELLANEYNHAVVYFETRKIRKGHYEIFLTEITREPRTVEYGVITEKCNRLLEQTIQKEPAYWIWSHKRWKREVPEDLEELKKEQKEKFLKKYRN